MTCNGSTLQALALGAACVNKLMPSAGLHSTPPGTPWNMVHDVFRKLADGDLKGTGDLALLKPSILDKVRTDFVSLCPPGMRGCSCPR